MKKPQNLWADQKKLKIEINVQKTKLIVINKKSMNDQEKPSQIKLDKTKIINAEHTSIMI